MGLTKKSRPPRLFLTAEWRFRGSHNRLRLELEPTGHDLVPGSEAEFITEHYWGYTARRNGATAEYRVEHPPWRVQQASSSHLDCAAAALYGEAFRDVLAAPPVSAFLAQGSAITVHQGSRLAP